MNHGRQEKRNLTKKLWKSRTGDLSKREARLSKGMTRKKAGRRKKKGRE